MIERLTETFIGGVELLEAEGRLVKHHAVTLVAGAVVLTLLLTMSFLAVGAAITGAVIWLSAHIGVGPAIVSLATPAAIASLAITHHVYHRLRDSGHPSP